MGQLQGQGEEKRRRWGGDPPLGLLGALGVLLGVTQRLDVDGVSLGNLVGGPVADEDGLSTPLEGGGKRKERSAAGRGGEGGREPAPQGHALSLFLHTPSGERPPGRACARERRRGAP